MVAVLLLVLLCCWCRGWFVVVFADLFVDLPVDVLVFLSLIRFVVSFSFFCCCRLCLVVLLLL